jgi:magnesium chelatase family protein
VSGPLFDRIDIHIQVSPVVYDDIINKKPGEKSEAIRQRVKQARQRQIERFSKLNIHDIYTNAMMPSNVVKKVCNISDRANLIIKKTMERLGLSARAYDKILKVSRTIADLAHSDDIHDDHVAEAIKYRSLDRSSWGDLYSNQFDVES